jgi:hypothetical protein
MATDEEARAALYFIKRVKQDPIAQTRLLAILAAASQRAKK